MYHTVNNKAYEKDTIRFGRVYSRQSTMSNSRKLKEKKSRFFFSFHCYTVILDIGLFFRHSFVTISSTCCKRVGYCLPNSVNAVSVDNS